MVTAIFSIIACIFLIPILFILKLPFSKKGKIILIVCAGLIGNVGLLLNQFIPVWQLAILLFSILYLMTLFLSRKAIDLLEKRGADTNELIFDEDSSSHQTEKSEELVVARNVVATSQLEVATSIGKDNFSDPRLANVEEKKNNSTIDDDIIQEIKF